ncbi:MAG: hypothetical protein ACMG6S_23890 [Byssovorax sp.]
MAQMAHAAGTWCGVLFTDPACLPDAESRETDKIDAAYRRGYYLDDRSIDKLKEVAGAHQRHKDSAEVLRHLDIVLRGREVAVLFVWKGCVAYLMAIAHQDPDRHFPEEHRPPLLNERYLRAHLLGPKEPSVETPHQDNPAKVAPRNPVVKTSRHHDPVKAARAPTRAANPDDRTPAVGRARSKARTALLDPRLVRMVLRVPPELQEDLISLSERLFDETRLEYSYAAIIRGLIALGLGAVVGKESLAVEFAGARVPRGRKRGTARNRSEREDE